MSYFARPTVQNSKIFTYDWKKQKILWFQEMFDIFALKMTEPVADFLSWLLD